MIKSCRKYSLSRLGAASLCFLAFCCDQTAAAQTTSIQAGCPGTDGPCLTAVSGQAASGPQLSVNAIGFSLQEEADVVKDRPYQAQATTEMKQTLADGSHIVQSIKAEVARDSEGRTVRIQQLGDLGPLTAQGAGSAGTIPTLTTIFDPVAKVHIDYTSNRNTAHVMALAPAPAGATTITAGAYGLSSTGPVTAVGGQAIMMQRGVASPDAPGQSAKTEQLGTKTVEGVEATGTRTTSVVPAGTIGNEKDLVITRETWYSPDLKLIVLSIQDDPRFGQTTYSLDNLQQVEPDANLFRVPANYKTVKTPVFLSPNR